MSGICWAGNISNTCTMPRQPAAPPLHCNTETSHCATAAAARVWALQLPQHQVHCSFTTNTVDAGAKKDDVTGGPGNSNQSHPTVAGGPEALVPPQATFHLTSFSQIPVDTQYSARVAPLRQASMSGRLRLLQHTHTSNNSTAHHHSCCVQNRCWLSMNAALPPIRNTQKSSILEFREGNSQSQQQKI